MRKVIVLAGLFLLTLSFIVSAEEGQDIEVAPIVISKEGSSDLSFIATRWPDFYDYDPAGTCGDTLKNTYSKKRKVQGIPDSWYPVCDGGKFCYITDAVDPETGAFQSYPNASARAGFVVYEYTPQPLDYIAISDLNTTIDFTGELAEYRRTAKILVTWTVRLEGEKFVIQPNRAHTPWFSEGCSGTSYQAFPKGNAYTRLFVNGEAKGNPSIMTIPYGGKGIASGVVDPTHTGSLVLTPDMFPDNILPERLNLEVKLYNDTSMKLVSPGGMRNLIVVITPLS